MPTNTLKLSQIRIDGGTQPRVAIDEDHVADLVAAIAAGVDLPPADVYFDGTAYWLADGFHRYHAHSKAGLTTLPVHVHKGTKRDAILFSVGANTSHGLKRSNADKAKAVTTLLNDKEWGEWSNKKIAELAGVSEYMVRSIREGASSIKSKMRKVERTGKQYVQDTTNIGRKPAPEVFYDDPPAVDAAPKTVEPAQLKDQAGNVIERPDVRAVFERRHELVDLMKQVSALKSTILRGHENDDLYAYVNPTQVQAALGNVYQALKFALPHARCPYHADDALARRGCRACGGLGWVPQEKYEAGVKALKAGGAA